MPHGSGQSRRAVRCWAVPGRCRRRRHGRWSAWCDCISGAGLPAGRTPRGLAGGRHGFAGAGDRGCGRPEPAGRRAGDRHRPDVVSRRLLRAGPRGVRTRPSRPAAARDQHQDHRGDHPAAGPRGRGRRCLLGVRPRCLRGPEGGGSAGPHRAAADRRPRDRRQPAGRRSGRHLSRLRPVRLRAGLGSALSRPARDRRPPGDGRICGGPAMPGTWASRRRRDPAPCI